MLNLIKIAITGSIATGKSSALKVFEKFDSYTLSADKIVHKLLKEDQILKKNITDLLGEEVIEQNELNRKKIAKKVFICPEKLKSLENLIHPKVLDYIEKTYEKISRDKKYKLFVVEMPLIYEMQKENFFDIILVISAKEKIAKERYKESDFEIRKNLQMSLNQKEKKATYIIENNSTIKSLENKVYKFITTL
ncbi:MAG: Dephospho-CoA kinase [Candidatus Anoxychlamydiales bacterium]|nr:Dephospho-CoA kinase [Candidatus Anoxychlamydiales bacterium]